MALMNQDGVIRKLMKRQGSYGDVRFVTFSCQGRLPLLHNDGIRDLFARSLSDARARFGFRLFAWVVMPEHVHLLITPGEGCDVARAMLGIKLPVAKRVIARWEEIRAPILDRITLANRTRRFWLQGGGFDRKIRDMEAFSENVQYIHRNPVTRGLVVKPEEWRWSSARWWMGAREGEVPCDDPPGARRNWNEWKGFV